MMSLNRKNEFFVLQQVDLISSQTSLDENQLALVHMPYNLVSLMLVT